jgi:hypothetical protein
VAVWRIQWRDPSPVVMARVLVCGGAWLRPGPACMELGAGNAAHGGGQQSTAAGPIRGDEGQFDTGLQVNDSDGQGVAA